MSCSRVGRLHLSEVRDVFYMVAVCRQLGRDGIAWRRQLAASALKVWDADFANWADNRVVGPPGGPEGWIRPISIIDDGWDSDEQREHFWRYVRRGRMEDNPLRPLLDARTSPRVARRCDVLPDAEWYESSFYQQQLQATGFDDVLLGVIQREPDRPQWLWLQRKAGRPPFSRREKHLLKVLLIELDRLQTNELSGVEDSDISALPPRMLQVLGCLLTGSTAKETAEQLDLSEHTVQQHIRRLYKKAHVSNRAELADRFRHIAPLLISMPPDVQIDSHRQITTATRNPWPAGIAADERNDG